MLKRHVLTVPVAQKPCILEVMCTTSISQTQLSSYANNFLGKHYYTCRELLEVNREICYGLAGSLGQSDKPRCLSSVNHNTKIKRRNRTSSERLISSLNFQYFTTQLQFQGRLCSSVPDTSYEDTGLRSTAIHLVVSVYL